MKTFYSHIQKRQGILASLFLMGRHLLAALTAKANHDHIKIDFFYNGSTVSVRGISDPGADLIIKITSLDGHQMLKQKGKVGGVLWMNVKTLNFENSPTFYAVHSTRNIEEILNSEDAEKNVIGYPALQKHISIGPVSGEEEKARWFDEFIKFKENSHLYSVSTGKITVTEKEGQGTYYILTEWPYQAPPGKYMVDVYAIKDKKIVESAKADVDVEQVGIVKSLAGMAKNNGCLYGLFSIIVAIGAGFGVSIISCISVRFSSDSPCAS